MYQEKKVLLVDDSPIYRHLISSHLREWGFEVKVATSGLEGLAALGEQESPRLVLLDWVMPGMDGVELCRKLRQRRPEEPYIYTILLTSKEGHSSLLEAMEAGVDDYLEKPFDQQELKARLQVGLRIVRLQQELIAAREAMRSAATYDALTGLLNRREIVDRLEKEVERCRRENRPLAIILADIDHFKAINDQMGHLAGDDVLSEVGRRLVAGIRSYDLAGRYGGEEFLMVLPGCDFLSAFRRAEQLRESLADTPIVLDGAENTVTVSMGLAVSDGQESHDARALLHRADLGLYKAKRNGRNRVEQVSPMEILAGKFLSAIAPA